MKAEMHGRGHSCVKKMKTKSLKLMQQEGDNLVTMAGNGDNSSSSIWYKQELSEKE